MVVVVTLESIVLLSLLVLVAGLLRSHADILRALHRLGVGPEDLAAEGPAPAPTVRLPAPAQAGAATRAHDLAGRTPAGESVSVSLSQRDAGGRAPDTLLAFLSSGCGTCAAFWSALTEGAHRRSFAGRVLVVTRDPAEERPGALAQLAPADVTVVMSSRAWDDYAVPGSPYFVLVDGRDAAVTGQGTASRWDQLEELIGRASTDRQTAGPAATGHQPASAWTTDAEREARADRELLAAGIHPGHPSLYPPALAEDEAPAAPTA